MADEERGGGGGVISVESLVPTLDFTNLARTICRLVDTVNAQGRRVEACEQQNKALKQGFAKADAARSLEVTTARNRVTALETAQVEASRREKELYARVTDLENAREVDRVHREQFDEERIGAHLRESRLLQEKLGESMLSVERVARTVRRKAFSPGALVDVHADDGGGNNPGEGNKPSSAVRRAVVTDANYDEGTYSVIYSSSSSLSQHEEEEEEEEGDGSGEADANNKEADRGVPERCLTAAGGDDDDDLNAGLHLRRLLETKLEHIEERFSARMEENAASQRTHSDETFESFTEQLVSHGLHVVEVEARMEKVATDVANKADNEDIALLMKETQRRAENLRRNFVLECAGVGGRHAVARMNSISPRWRQTLIRAVVPGGDGRGAGGGGNVEEEAADAVADFPDPVARATTADPVARAGKAAIATAMERLSHYDSLLAQMQSLVTQKMDRSDLARYDSAFQQISELARELAFEKERSSQIESTLLQVLTKIALMDDRLAIETKASQERFDSKRGGDRMIHTRLTVLEGRCRTADGWRRVALGRKFRRTASTVLSQSAAKRLLSNDGEINTDTVSSFVHAAVQKSLLDTAVARAEKEREIADAVEAAEEDPGGDDGSESKAQLRQNRSAPKEEDHGGADVSALRGDVETRLGAYENAFKQELGALRERVDGIQSRLFANTSSDSVLRAVVESNHRLLHNMAPKKDLAKLQLLTLRLHEQLAGRPTKDDLDSLRGAVISAHAATSVIADGLNDEEQRRHHESNDGNTAATLKIVQNLRALQVEISKKVDGDRVRSLEANLESIERRLFEGTTNSDGPANDVQQQEGAFFDNDSSASFGQLKLETAADVAKCRQEIDTLRNLVLSMARPTTAAAPPHDEKKPAPGSGVANANDASIAARDASEMRREMAEIRQQMSAVLLAAQRSPEINPFPTICNSEVESEDATAPVPSDLRRFQFRLEDASREIEQTKHNLCVLAKSIALVSGVESSRIVALMQNVEQLAEETVGTAEPKTSVAAFNRLKDDFGQIQRDVLSLRRGVLAMVQDGRKKKTDPEGFLTTHHCLACKTTLKGTVPSTTPFASFFGDCRREDVNYFTTASGHVIQSRDTSPSRLGASPSRPATSSGASSSKLCVDGGSTTARLRATTASPSSCRTLRYPAASQRKRRLQQQDGPEAKTTTVPS